MDLTALLGGAPGGSLNDDFAAVSASGDNVFAEAFGGVTSFLRPDRSRITIKFLFDPEREWGTLAILASVQTGACPIHQGMGWGRVEGWVPLSPIGNVLLCCPWDVARTSWNQPAIDPCLYLP